MRRLARALLYLGIAAVVLGLSKVHAAYVADPPYDYTGSFRFAWSFAYMALLALTAYGVGLPDIPRTARSVVVSAVGATLAAAAAISLVQLLVGDALLPRFVVLGSAVLLLPWYMVCAAVASGGRSRAEVRDRVLVVGSHADSDDLEHDLARAAERPASVVAVLSPEDARGEGDTSTPLLDEVGRVRATVVVLDRSAQNDQRVVDQAAGLHEGGVRVRTLSLFCEDWLGRLPVSELERVSLMFDIGEVHRARYGRVKRLLDVTVALVGFVPLALVTPVVLLVNLAFNRGPLVFHQPRVGKNGKVFEIYKFRTMRPIEGDAGAPAEWTGEDDPRITGFGRFLRVTHLDELPQVVNVIRGDLSIVGPRPEQPHYVEELMAKLPFYDLRHLVRPGLTGWAQVKYHYGADEADALEKLQYEFYYLRHQRLSLDLRIMGRTVRSVLGREGR